MSARGARVRRATAADAQALSRLAEETFRDTYAELAAPEDLEVYIAGHFGEGHQSRELRDPSLISWLAVAAESAGEEPVGYVQLRLDAPCPAPGSSEPGAEVARCYVRRDCHGQGVARLLIEAAIAGAREAGAAVVWLSVWTRNPRAIAFYRKSGLEVVGEATFTMGSDVQQDHVMALRLLS